MYNNVISPAYTFVSVYVTNPGNLSDPEKVERIKAVIAKFEALPGCKGAKFSKFWIRDYEFYLETKNEESSDSAPTAYTYEDLLNFLEWPEYEPWGGFMNFDNVTKRLEIG